MVSRWILLKMINISDKRRRENQKKYFKLNNVLLKSCRLWENVEKYCTAGQTTYGKIIQRMRIACWITTATDKISICNTYCFSTATMVTRTHFNVTLYVHCLSCLSCNVAFVYWKTLQCVSFIADLSSAVVTGCRGRCWRSLRQTPALERCIAADFIFKLWELLVGYDAMQSGKNVPTFQKNLLLTSSGCRNGK
jgi:hypothetical protein